MSDPIVLQVVKGWDNQTLLQLVKAPNVVDDDIGVTLFKCDTALLPGVGAPDTVTKHGQILLSCLMQSHARIKEALEGAFKLANGASCPIYLQLKSLPAAEAFCWEALCNEAGVFIALDRRWPVARLAGALNLAGRAVESYEFPLRIMVVLSALGRDATPEWDGLYAAVQKARKAGLPIALHVGTSQESLQDQIAEAAKIDSGLSQFALQTMVDLIEVADDFAPQLVHFFCHGSTTFDKPRLQLATINDHDDSSIEVTLPDLLGSPGVRESWLVVLNCCESGAASKDVHSLSHSLVAGGINAAIGMKEEVSEVDAAEFSSRLYPSLLDNLRAALVPMGPNDDAIIEWADAMWAPRRALRERHKADVIAHTWTLPVLYVQPEPFRVRRAPAPAADARAHSQTIEEMLALLPPDKRALFEAELAAVRAGH